MYACTLFIVVIHILLLKKKKNITQFSKKMFVFLSAGAGVITSELETVADY